MQFRNENYQILDLISGIQNTGARIFQMLYGSSSLLLRFSGAQLVIVKLGVNVCETDILVKAELMR